MKKIKCLLVTMMITTMLAGCGKEAASESSSNDANNADNKVESSEAEVAEEANSGEEANTYSYTLDGTKIVLNSEMSTVVDALGDPDKYFESDSCAFQGLDKVYTYGSVVITTYPDNEVDYVYTIDLKDDTVETDEGVYIGASKEDVEAAYGTPGSETDVAYIYTKGDTMLTIIFEDDCVIGITYSYVTE